MGRIGEYVSNLFELGGQERNRAMEGLRGLAVTLVFFVHYYSCFGQLLPRGGFGSWFAASLEWTGTAGVDLFFVLSGYLIYGAVIKGTFAYVPFMRRRVRRIYPTFLAVFVIYLGLAFLVPSERKIPAGLLPAAVYVAENALLIPGMVRIVPLITVAWSLSYEFFFYLVLPVVILATGLRQRTRRARLVTFAAMTVAIALITVAGGGHLQFVMFVAGMFIYEAVAACRGKDCSPFLRKGAVAAAILALPGAYLLGHRFNGAFANAGYLLRTLWLAVAFGWMVFVSFDPTSAVARACSAKWLRRLGNMSYSYYLIHGLALKGAAMVLGGFLLHLRGGLTYWWVLPVAYAVTLVVSSVLFAMIEKPLSLKPATAPPTTFAAPMTVTVPTLAK